MDRWTDALFRKKIPLQLQTTMRICGGHRRAWSPPFHLQLLVLPLLARNHLVSQGTKAPYHFDRHLRHHALCPQSIPPHSTCCGWTSPATVRRLSNAPYFGASCQQSKKCMPGSRWTSYSVAQSGVKTPMAPHKVWHLKKINNQTKTDSKQDLEKKKHVWRSQSQADSKTKQKPIQKKKQTDSKKNQNCSKVQ